MLAEHFIGSMDNGADFNSGWGEWDNVVMLSNRKAQPGEWAEEPLLVTPASSVSSGIPGVSPKSFSDRNSSLMMPGYSASPVKHEKAAAGEIVKAGPGGLNLEARSDAERKVNDKVCNSVASSHHKDFLLGLGGGGGTAALAAAASAAHSNKETGGGGDAETGLKLGLKRSFTPDSTVNSSTTNATNATNVTTNAAATATVIATTTTTTTTNKSSPGKKPRGSANHVPRCQVEGCKTDLSSAKDYHRRHKVCAMHSKSSRVSVNSIEQRFCQQCSRFHVLEEFDEGKRSCRRRLAGHNERRRKPQPDPMALTSAALAPYQAGFMRLAHERLFGYGTPLSYLGLDNLHGKMNWPRFGNIDEQAAAAAAGLLSASSSLCRPERFFMLFPQRKPAPGVVNGLGMQGGGGASGAMMGQNLSLSSSSPGPGVYNTGGLGPTQGVTGISDPGRALSLLSSQAWAATPSMEQRASYQQQAGYSSGAASQPPASLALVALDGTSQGQGSYMPLGVNSYENNSVLTLLHHESEFRGLPDQHARPTIDLMQMSTQSPPTAVVMQPGQVSSNSPAGGGGNGNNNNNNNATSSGNNNNNNSNNNAADFQVLKPYSSTAMYDPHQL